MKIYDVISELEKLIRENNPGMSLVLHRNMQTHPSVKIMKKFNYTLYLIENKEKKELIKKTFIDKCPSGDIDDVWTKQDIIFVFHILRWMETEEYKRLRNGVQQISDKL